MSSQNKEESSIEFEFGDERDEVLRVAKIKGIDWEIKSHKIKNGATEQSLYVLLPNGRRTRRVYTPASRAGRLLKGDFSEWIVLGDYAAYYNQSVGILEALVQIGPRPSPLAHPAYLPGVIVDDQLAANLATLTNIEDEIEDARERLNRDWRLPIETKYSSLSMQFQRSTEEIKALGPLLHPRAGGTSLYITGLETDRHDDALDVLERFSSALFFELDLQFDLALTLARRRGIRPLTRLNEPKDPAKLRPLAHAYSEQPVSLYFYARSATEMPLLQYLAYYQAIEFFFPSFTNSEILRKLRYKLRDPRFDSEDDVSLQSLVSIASGTKRGGFSEGDQLRMTLEACVDNNDLHSYLVSDDTREEFFAKNTTIKGTKKVVVSERDRLVQQIAERVYAIRCRIVHSKEGGEGARQEALLPTGPESENLHQDILLLQFLAQRVIISGSRGRLV